MKNIVTNVPNCVNELLLKFVGTIFVLSSILVPTKKLSNVILVLMK